MVSNLFINAQCSSEQINIKQYMRVGRKPSQQGPSQYKDKLQGRSVQFVQFTVCAQRHSFITLGEWSDDYNCKTFTLSGGGEKNKGDCAIRQQHFFQNSHEAHGLHVCWQAEETHEGWKLTLNSSALQLWALRANAIWQHGAGNIFRCFDVSIKRFISAEK